MPVSVSFKLGGLASLAAIAMATMLIVASPEPLGVFGYVGGWILLIIAWFVAVFGGGGQ